MNIWNTGLPLIIIVTVGLAVLCIIGPPNNRKREDEESKD